MNSKLKICCNIILHYFCLAYHRFANSHGETVIEKLIFRDKSIPRSWLIKIVAGEFETKRGFDLAVLVYTVQSLGPCTEFRSRS